MREANEDAWLVPLVTSPGAVTLVCAPYAGGRPEVFLPLARALGDLNVLAVQLPGHGRRIRERPLTSAAEAVAGLAPAVQKAVPGPLVLLGHSMGALVALELARALERSGPQPDHLIVSACTAPAELGRAAPWHELPDDQMIEQLIALGAEPEPFAIPELRDLALPLLRADLELVETFDTEPRTPLRCPISAIAGTGDPDAPPARMARWDRETAASFHTRTIAGGHFLLEERLTDMVDAVRDILSTAGE